MSIRLLPSHWPRCQYRVRYAEARESIFRTPGWRAFRHRYWVIDVGPRKGNIRVHNKVHRRNQQSVGLYAPGTLYEENVEVGQLVSWTWLLVEEKGTPSRLRALTGKNGFILLNDPGQTIRKAIIALVSVSQSHTEARAFHLNALLHQILATLFDLHECRPPPPSSRIPSVHPWRSTARDYLEANPASLNTNELARLLGVSLSTLTHRYHAVCGETLSQTIAGWRLEKASALLTRPELSIKEIATLLGFRHQAHLSGFFKKETGFTPSQYRQTA